MSPSDQAQARCGRFAGRRVLPRRVRHPADAQALDRLPDSDILSALHDLPDELQLAVYLADVEGYHYSEIALIMGTPVGTVASRLHHGRARLRDRLAAIAVQRGLATAPG
jgi:RNA polymerase sigma-70 factor (ECF subfamily)